MTNAGLVPTNANGGIWVDDKASENFDMSTNTEKSFKKGTPKETSTEGFANEHTGEVDKNMPQQNSMTGGPQAISTSVANQQSQLATFPRFMELPPEIRDLIYERVLESTLNDIGLVTSTTADSTENHDGDQSFPALLYTSRAIREESRGAYFRVAKGRLAAFKAQHEVNMAVEAAVAATVWHTINKTDFEAGFLVFYGGLSARSDRCIHTQVDVDGNNEKWLLLEQTCEVLAQGLNKTGRARLGLEKGAVKAAAECQLSDDKDELESSDDGELEASDDGGLD